MTKPTVGPRLVAIALIVLSSSIHSQPRFLVVSSRKHADKWVLPKGGIEATGGTEHDGSESSREAAERESWEEAGLIQGSALHLTHLAVLPDLKPHPSSPSSDPTQPSFVPSTTYAFEIFSVSSEGSEVLAEEWPEKKERDRKWVQGWSELEKTLCWGRRQEVMREAIKLARARLE